MLNRIVKSKKIEISSELQAMKSAAMAHFTLGPKTPEFVALAKSFNAALMQEHPEATDFDKLVEK